MRKYVVLLFVALLGFGSLLFAYTRHRGPEKKGVYCLPGVTEKEMAEARDSKVEGTLRIMSRASESFAAANAGQYARSIEDLTDADPPYFDRFYCNETISGFKYTCQFSPQGYQFTATPVSYGSKGPLVFVIQTEGEQTMFRDPSWRYRQKSPAPDDAGAQSILRTLSAAAEAFALDHGKYPLSEEDLTVANPPYIYKAYCGETESGFRFTCDFSTGNYRFKAMPVNPGETGTHTFTITMGGVLRQVE